MNLDNIRVVVVGTMSVGGCVKGTNLEIFTISPSS